MTMLSCLLVQQPYASLIAFGRKRWEFRSYETKKRGRIGVAASPSSALDTMSPSLNRVSHLFPRGMFLGTAELVNCFYVTGADLKRVMTEPVALKIHGHEIATLDSPIGEPKEDVDSASNSDSWESFVWQLEEVKPVSNPVHIVKNSRSTWALVDFDEEKLDR